MTFGIYDILVIAAIVVLSFLTFMYFLPKLIKQKVKPDTKSYPEWVVENLEKMFIKKKISQVRMIILGSTFGTGLFLFLLFVTIDSTFALVLLIVGMLVGHKLPRWLVLYLQKNRIKKFNFQMIDALTLLSNALKSGLSISQGLENVARQMPKPISQEFNLILSEQKVGTTLEESFINLGKRVPCEDVDMFVTAVIILKETGGNLSETFDTIVETIRARVKVQQKISALVSQGLMQAIIIFLMPFGLAIAFYSIDPNHIIPMFNTLPGLGMLALMLTLQTIGGLVMWKIIKIEV